MSYLAETQNQWIHLMPVSKCLNLRIWVAPTVYCWVDIQQATITNRKYQSFYGARITNTPMTLKSWGQRRWPSLCCLLQRVTAVAIPCPYNDTTKNARIRVLAWLWGTTAWFRQTTPESLGSLRTSAARMGHKTASQGNCTGMPWNSECWREENTCQASLQRCSSSWDPLQIIGLHQNSLSYVF